ncbi:MAG: hypothetical protein U0804_17995 [Gemmataceae bacterium]
MNELVRFTNLLKQRKYAVEDLDRFAELIEPIRDSAGLVGYRMKPLAEADRVTQRCEVLLQYTWACRDYVKKILKAHGITDPGLVVNRYIRDSREIQVVSYLANAHKHAGTGSSQQWAVELAPRLGKPYVLGQQHSFPHQLKPTVMIRGDSFPELEFMGSARIGDEVHEFTSFEWRYCCEIEDKDGNRIGSVWGACQVAFQTWLTILIDKGISV